jgi:hypothetical protein
MSDFGLIVFGFVLIGLGLIVSGTTPSPGAQAKTVAVTLADSVKQVVDANLAAAKGQRAKTERDWFGWIVAGLGALLLLIGLFR